MSTTAIVDLDPAEEIAAPRFRVICPACDESRTVRVAVSWHAAMVDQFGREAMSKRFHALDNNPPESRCPECLLRYGNEDPT